MPLSSKVKTARYRQRVNSDPAARAAYLERRRESYQRRKQQGRIPYVKSSELSDRERKKQRGKWKAASSAYRDRKKMANAVTPPSMENTEDDAETSTSADQDVPEPPMIKEEEDEQFELETEGDPEKGILLRLDLFRPETSTSVDQDVPEPPMIKEEVKEYSTSQEDEHFKLETEGAPQEGILLRLERFYPETSTNVHQDVPEPSMIKQEEDEHFELETEALKPSPTHEKSESGEEQLQIMDLDQTGSAAEEEPPSSSPERLVPSKSDRKTLQVLVLRRDYSQDVETIGEQFECTVCGEVFSVYADLNLHMKMHADNKRYQCKFCKKEFTASSSVSRHHRVHTGEKPYECDLCGKRFNINSALKIHYRIHTGEKPYKCKTCGKSFTTSSNRKQHSILHTKPARPRMKSVSESRSEEV